MGIVKLLYFLAFFLSLTKSQEHEGLGRRSMGNYVPQGISLDLGDLPTFVNKAFILKYIFFKN